MAKQLGHAITQDERYVRYLSARDQYDQDEKLQQLIEKFNKLKNDVVAAGNEQPRDEGKLKGLTVAMRALYEQTMQNQTMAEFMEAKKQVDDLVRQVSAIITYYVAGEQALEGHHCSGCSSSCEDCAGCDGSCAQ